MIRCPFPLLQIPHTHSTELGLVDKCLYISIVFKNIYVGLVLFFFFLNLLSVKNSDLH